MMQNESILYNIHLEGLFVTEFLQTKLKFAENFFTLVSTVTDPSLLYVVYFPVVFGLIPEVGLRLLHAAVLGEWLNLFMKWTCLGERPYWWVHENHLTHVAKIEQFYNTCETGPGTPSGHVTITVMVFYVLTSAISNKARAVNRLDLMSIAWVCYATLVILVGISRAYIAAHFIHQCILGVFSGLPFGKLVNSVNLQSFSFRHYVVATIFFIGSIFSLNGVLMLLDIDANWTVSLAKNWCLKQEWIHVATSPYYVMWRFIGTMFALGLIRRSSQYDSILVRKVPSVYKLALAVSGVVTSYVCLYMIPNTKNSLFLYFSIFFVYMSITYIVGTLLPKMVMHPVKNN